MIDGETQLLQQHNDVLDQQINDKQQHLTKLVCNCTKINIACLYYAYSNYIAQCTALC